MPGRSSARSTDAAGHRRRTVPDQEFRTLVQTYSNQLYAYVIRRVHGDHHLCEEIVQETLLRAWQHPDILAERRDSFRPWLYTVARNLVYDHGRAVAARPVCCGQTELPALPDRDDSIARLLDGDEANGLLARLPRIHRDVFVQVYYLDRTQEVAARALGIPVGTVKSRLNRAHELVRLLTGASLNKCQVAVADFARPAPSLAVA